MYKLTFVLMLLTVMLSVRNVYSIKFRITFMAPKTSDQNFTVSTSIGAFYYGLELVENNTELLKGHSFSVVWLDSACSGKTAAGRAVEMKDETDVFIGPPCSPATVTVGQLASYWNKPVFSWVSTDKELSNKNEFTTLVRTLSPLDKFAHIFHHFFYSVGWRRAGLLVFSNVTVPELFEHAIESEFLSSNMSITSKVTLPSNPQPYHLERGLRKLKKSARVILLAVSVEYLRQIMLIAHKLDMTNGEYTFFSVDHLAQEGFIFGQSWHGNDDQNDDAKKAMRALLHITYADDFADDYTTTKDIFNRRKLFSAKCHDAGLRGMSRDGVANVKLKKEDTHSLFLPDTVLLWAKVVDELLKLDLDYKSGTVVFQHSKWKVFNGTSGQVLIDDNGDRYSNFWLWNLDEYGSWRLSMEFLWRSTPGAEHSQFDLTHREIIPIKWPNSLTGLRNAPPDVPQCGFDGLLCAKVGIYVLPLSLMLASGFFIAILLIGTTLHRKHLNSKKSMSLWKIDYAKIGLHENLPKSNLSKLNFKVDRSFSSLGTGASNSAVQYFTPGLSIGLYEGEKVALKVIRKTEISKRTATELCQLRNISHSCINKFIGVCITTSNITVLWAYCSKNSLKDVLSDNSFKIDKTFKLSFISDLIKGMEFLHKNTIGRHGRLKSSNCLIDSRWVCKISGFGLTSLLGGDSHRAEKTEDAIFTDYFWTAPEILRSAEPKQSGTQKGDVYSFGVILTEIFTRKIPYSELELPPKEIIEMIISSTDNKAIAIHPSLRDADVQNCDIPFEILYIPKQCLATDPKSRPAFFQIHKHFKRNRGNIQVNVVDHMISMMEKYTDHLEELVADRTQEVEDERKKTDKILYQLLPKSVADKLKVGEEVKAESFESVTIYFSDIVGFTVISADSSPIEVVSFLNRLYTIFDNIIMSHDAFKVETIGDAYLVVSGLPHRNGNRHVHELALTALKILQAVNCFEIPHLKDRKLQIRIGLHTGPCCAGVVGITMPKYCLFGDSVNTASRMESHGKPMKIHISSATKDALMHFPEFITIPRGEIEIKGKGIMFTYWLTGVSSSDTQPTDL